MTVYMHAQSDVYRHVSSYVPEHVPRHVYRHLYRHAYRYVERNMNGHVYRAGSAPAEVRWLTRTALAGERTKECWHCMNMAVAGTVT